MFRFKLHDLRCFDAVATRGSFQAAGTALGLSHPSVFSAIARLERDLGLQLLDRSGYRVTLTEAGRAFHDRARLTLGELEQLQSHADQLATGEETTLRIVIGDLCPRPPALRWLSRFFRDRPRTRLHLDYEAVGGPLERLLDGDADLIFHRAEPSDPRLEAIPLFEVAMIPVVAPGFLPFAPSPDITPDQMQPFTQCVIRDTARNGASEDHFLIEGTHRCSAPGHVMKKELILHGLAWGHLPAWLVQQELREGHLLSIAGVHLPGRVEQVAAVRRRGETIGPVTGALWAELVAWEASERSI